MLWEKSHWLKKSMGIDFFVIDKRELRSQLSNDWDIMMLGYEYVAGGRGRGNSATFRRIRKN